ncbi:MAG: glycosyltransferase [Ignavibacteria bacterium]
MKVIIVGTAYPMRGGIAQYNALLYKHLKVAHNVKIFSFKRQYPKLLFPGKTQYEEGTPAVQISKEDNKIIIDSVNPFNWFVVAYRIKKEKPDLIIFKYWIPFFVPCFFTIFFITKLFLNTKVLVICDNIIPHERRLGDVFLTKVLFSVVDFFIVQSKAVETDLVRFNKKNKPYRFAPHPLYNIFGEKVDKIQARNFLESNFGINAKNEKVLLFFGYVRKYKGLSYLLNAMPLILNQIQVKLLVVGEFYEDKELYFQYIKELGIEKYVDVINNFVPDEMVRYFFSASDCVVLPYLNATQSGIVQICYYYNKPVIVTNVGGLSEVVINEKTGLVINPASSAEISEAVIRFYAEKLEEKFAKYIETEKKKYRWETFVSEIESLYLQSKNH